MMLTVKLRLTAVSDAQHGGFATGWSPVYWGSIDDLFVNLTMPPTRRRRPRRHPGPVWARRRHHHADLRGADARKATRRDPAPASRLCRMIVTSHRSRAIFSPRPLADTANLVTHYSPATTRRERSTPMPPERANRRQSKSLRASATHLSCSIKHSARATHPQISRRDTRRGTALECPAPGRTQRGRRALSVGRDSAPACRVPKPSPAFR